MSSSLWQFLSLVFIYGWIVLVAYYLSRFFLANDSSNSKRGGSNSKSSAAYDHPRRLSPLIGTNNASKAFSRFDFVHKQFEKALSSKHDWKVLRSADNITIETMESEDTEWPIYIKTTSIIEADAASISRLFTWPLFQKTQGQIDPFHESFVHHASTASGDTHIITKYTKRPLFMPKRQFHGALIETKQKHAFSLDNFRISGGTGSTSAYRNLQVTRGTLVNGMINVQLTTAVASQFSKTGGGAAGEDLELLLVKPGSDSHYVTAFQDLVTWFIPVSYDELRSHITSKKTTRVETIDDNIYSTSSGSTGSISKTIIRDSLFLSSKAAAVATVVVTVMRVDLGPDIPRWGFMATVAATGIWSMKELKKLALLNSSKKLKS